MHVLELVGILVALSLHCYLIVMVQHRPQMAFVIIWQHGLNNCDSDVHHVALPTLKINIAMH